MTYDEFDVALIGEIHRTQGDDPAVKLEQLKRLLDDAGKVGDPVYLATLLQSLAFGGLVGVAGAIATRSSRHEEAVKAAARLSRAALQVLIDLMEPEAAADLERLVSPSPHVQ